MTNEFGLSKKEDIFKKDIGKEVIIYNINGNNTMLGVIHSIDEEWVYLKPFYGKDYTLEEPKIKRIYFFNRIEKEIFQV